MDVELQHIAKRFGSVQANDDVSLTIRAGTIHGLLGENGAGKSTLVKILSGFVTRDRGDILLDGKPVAIRTPADGIRAGIGMLHQDPLDFPPLTELDNFIIGRPGGILASRRAAAREFHGLAAQFGFSLEADQMVGQLTMGERQQLELLRLLSLGVEILILDEPTTGISASQKSTLFTALRKLTEQGKSIIFVSHKLEDVEELCDAITVMRGGHIVGHATVPCQTAQLVSMMFGRELATPINPKTCGEAVALNVKSLRLSDDRLDIEISELSVRCGEVIGLAGLEGSGQRLLLLACAGIQHPPAGLIQIRSTDVTHKPYNSYLQAGAGYLPADRLREGLIGGLSIQEHVALRTASRGLLIDWAQTRETSQKAIQRFNIRGLPDTRVSQLSGGNQQRAQLSLLPEPLNLLLLEHPTRGLDIESTIWVWQQLIGRCVAGTAILFASSDLDEIMQYSDRVMVFSGGKASPLIDASTLTVESLGKMIGGKFG